MPNYGLFTNKFDHNKTADVLVPLRTTDDGNIRDQVGEGGRKYGSSRKISPATKDPVAVSGLKCQFLTPKPGAGACPYDFVWGTGVSQASLGLEN
jgi:hypothetical protein